jgi:BR serine/threonine kinase
MLTSRIGPDQIDWSQSAGSDPTTDPIMFEGESGEAYAVNGSDPFHRQNSAEMPMSLGPTSVAIRPEWAFDGVAGAEVTQSHMVRCQGLTLVDLVRILQLLITRMGMQWFHPDEYTLYVRHEASGLYLAIQALGGNDALDVGFVVQFFRGDYEDFQRFCRSAEEALAGNLAG